MELSLVIQKGWEALTYAGGHIDGVCVAGAEALIIGGAMLAGSAVNAVVSADAARKQAHAQQDALNWQKEQVSKQEKAAEEKRQESLEKVREKQTRMFARKGKKSLFSGSSVGQEDPRHSNEGLKTIG